MYSKHKLTLTGMATASLKWSNPIFVQGCYHFQYKCPARERVWVGSQGLLIFTHINVSIYSLIL